MIDLRIFGVKAFNPALKGVIRDLRPLWLMEEIGIRYERKSLDTQAGENQSPDYLRLNPFGKVPTLQDGDFTIFESAAICQYIAEKHGRFFPEKGTPEYYLCLQWCYFAVTNVEPQCGRIFGADHFSEKNETTATIRATAVSQLGRFLPVLEKTFEKQNTLMSWGFSVADILLTTALNMNIKSEIYENYPNIRKYMRAMSARPAFKRAMDLNGQ
jgi:glutathione S-transferase